LECRRRYRTLVLRAIAESCALTPTILHAKLNVKQIKMLTHREAKMRGCLKSLLFAGLAVVVLDQEGP